MFKIIIIVYCLVGLFYNIMLIPRKNTEIYKQNQYILERYKQMEIVLNKISEKLNEF